MDFFAQLCNTRVETRAEFARVKHAKRDPLDVPPFVAAGIVTRRAGETLSHVLAALCLARKKWLSYGARTLSTGVYGIGGALRNPGDRGTECRKSAAAPRNHTGRILDKIAAEIFRS